MLDVKHGSRISTVRGRVEELTILDFKPWFYDIKGSRKSKRAGNA